MLALRGGESAIRAPRRIRGQRDGALQERCRGGDSTARLRPAGRALELRGNLLIRPRRGRSQMPSPAVGIELAVGRRRQRAMCRPTFLSLRRSINGGARKRMAESHALAESQQPVRFRINR